MFHVFHSRNLDICQPSGTRDPAPAFPWAGSGPAAILLTLIILLRADITAVRILQSFLSFHVSMRLSPRRTIGHS